jgi:hypothetical protein
MFTPTTSTTINTARTAAYTKLTKNYTIYRSGDTIVNAFGDTYTVAYTIVSGYDLRIVTTCLTTFAPCDIMKV